MGFVGSFLCAPVMNAVDLCVFYVMWNKRQHALFYN